MITVPEIQTVTSLGEIQKGREGMMDVTDISTFMKVLEETSRGVDLKVTSISNVPTAGLARRLDAAGLDHPPIGSQRIIFVRRN